MLVTVGTKHARAPEPGGALKQDQRIPWVMVALEPNWMRPSDRPREPGNTTPKSHLSNRGLTAQLLAAAGVAARQWRVLAPIVAGLLAAIAMMIGALWGLSVATGTPMALLTRDPAATTGAKFYIGVLSNVGALIWCATATTCLLGWAALRKTRQHREVAGFLRGAGVLVMFLGLDDFFMLHEVVYPRLGLEEGAVVALYGAGLLGLVVRYRLVILGSELLLLLIGAALFVVSVLVDGFVPDSTAFEDIPKASAILFWLCYFWRLSLDRMGTKAA